MSKKRKQQEELAKQQAMQQQEARHAPLRVSFRIMENCFPIPVAPPATMIQLTPIVQPIPFEPYNTQMQPLFQYDIDQFVGSDDYDDRQY